MLARVGAARPRLAAARRRAATLADTSRATPKRGKPRASTSPRDSADLPRHARTAAPSPRRSSGRDAEPSDVAALVGELTEAGLRKQTIRKTVSVLAMILDHHGVQPNPARDPRVKLPREEKRELAPPTADDVLAVYALLPSVYRLPLLVLDATGMRVGELETLTWGDVDSRRGRWRIRTAAAKTRAARWVNPSPVVFDAVDALVPRDDRVPDRPVFGGFGADRFRTALARACIGAGIASFSPHDLRHRRVSLLHAQGLHGRASAKSSATPTSSPRRGRTRTSSSTNKNSTTKAWCREAQRRRPGDGASRRRVVKGGGAVPDSCRHPSRP